MDFLQQNEKINLPVTFKQSIIKLFVPGIIFIGIGIIAIIEKSYIFGILIIIVVITILLKNIIKKETITLNDNVIVFEGHENITIRYSNIYKLDIVVYPKDITLEIYEKNQEMCSKGISTNSFFNKELKKIMRVILMKNPETMLSDDAKLFIK